MIVTDAQLAKMHQAAEARFQRALCRHLRESCGTTVAALDDRELARFVATGVEIARAYDFTWQSSLASFVSMMAIISPTFYVSPPIAAALEEFRSAADHRLSVLLRRLPASVWEGETADPREAVRRFADGLDT